MKGKVIVTCSYRDCKLCSHSTFGTVAQSFTLVEPQAHKNTDALKVATRFIESKQRRLNIVKSAPYALQLGGITWNYYRILIYTYLLRRNAWEMIKDTVSEISFGGTVEKIHGSGQGSIIASLQRELREERARGFSEEALRIIAQLQLERDTVLLQLTHSQSLEAIQPRTLDTPCGNGDSAAGAMERLRFKVIELERERDILLDRIYSQTSGSPKLRLSTKMARSVSTQTDEVVFYEPDEHASAAEVMSVLQHALRVEEAKLLYHQQSCNLHGRVVAALHTHVERIARVEADRLQEEGLRLSRLAEDHVSRMRNDAPTGTSCDRIRGSTRF